MCQSATPPHAPLDLTPLIQRTCACARGSPERQRHLDHLIRAMVSSGKLVRPGDIPAADYQDLLQKSWIYLCQNLCEATTASQAYDPSQASVTTWFNAYLKKRKLDYWLSHQRQTLQDKAMPECWEPPAPTPAPPILEEIQAWIEQERRMLLRIHVRNRPEVNCYLLLLRRLPPETSFKQLAQDFDIAETTIQGFYVRECLPRLRQAGVALGYLPDTATF